MGICCECDSSAPIINLTCLKMVNNRSLYLNSEASLQWHGIIVCDF